MERMEEHLPDFNYQSVQHTISHAQWEHRPLMDEVARRADGLLGGGSRIRIILDDTALDKKGNHSVGVENQYNGRLGKIHNSQVAVCASLASGNYATLIDIRLYLTESWCNNPTRCEAAGVPENERKFYTKPQIAREIIKHQRELGVRFDVTCMDSGYGNQAELLHGLDSDGEVFVAEVHCDQQVWLDNPWHHNQGKRIGSTLKKEIPSEPSSRVDAWAAAQKDTDWQRLRARDSDQGWVEVNYLKVRIWTYHEGQEKCWWLLVWEDPEERTQKAGKTEGPRRHYALSNAGCDCDPRQLVGDGLGRGIIENNFRDAKSEVGMADYQVRGWLAWHHHMALVMLALLFLITEKMHCSIPDGCVKVTSGDIVAMLERLLPSRPQSEQEAQSIVRKRMQARQRDQDRRKRKTARERPPLLPDEILNQRT